MTTTPFGPVTVLGLGEMGRALARTLVKAGAPTTVWNRTPGRDTDLVAAGARGATTPAEAVHDGGLLITVLLDHASVHDTLDPIAGALTGRRWLNLTSTSPEESRELARWAADHGIDFLDGGIMAVPPMIGTPASALLYSGSRTVFDAHRPLLELFGAAEYFDTDPGTAALLDFALLANMYLMFAGFFQGSAMARTAGFTAADFAARAVPWVTAMAQGLPEYARVIDSGDYTAEVQHLAFQKAALDAISRAATDAGVGDTLIAPLAALVDRQVAKGNGASAFARVTEELH
ncbi:NAD(P)-binding domain-containing protein [Nocardia sp. NPDC005978]|uniref:NAD(P)-dependent oxidoreductase n=1 Tax=Nocardia sp. NPDC005978 TaxID=3156725 RepID=UPI0033B3DAF6